MNPTRTTTHRSNWIDTHGTHHSVETNRGEYDSHLDAVRAHAADVSLAQLSFPPADTQATCDHSWLYSYNSRLCVRCNLTEMGSFAAQVAPPPGDQ